MSWSSRGCQSVPQCQSDICSGLVGIPQFVSITHCVYIGDGSQIRVSYGQLLGSDSWLTAALAIRQLGECCIERYQKVKEESTCIKDYIPNSNFSILIHFLSLILRSYLFFVLGGTIVLKFNYPYSAHNKFPRKIMLLMLRIFNLLLRQGVCTSFCLRCWQID